MKLLQDCAYRRNAVPEQQQQQQQQPPNPSLNHRLQSDKARAAAPEINIDDLEEFLEHLNDKSIELKTVDSEIEKFATVEELENELLIVEEYREKITSFRFKAKKSIQKFNKAHELSSVNTQPHTSKEIKNDGVKASENIHVKLPKLTIPKFYGELSEWLTFWNSFS